MMILRNILFLSTASVLSAGVTFANAQVIHEKSWGLTTLLSPTEFKSTVSVENQHSLDALTVTENRFASLTERVLEFKNGEGTLIGIARMRPWGNGLVRFYKVDEAGNESLSGSFKQKNREGRLYDADGNEIAYSVATELRDRVIAYQVQEAATGEILIEATRSRESSSVNQWTLQGVEAYLPLLVSQVVYDTIGAYRSAEAKIALGLGAAALVSYVGYQGAKHAGLFKPALLEEQWCMEDKAAALRAKEALFQDLAVNVSNIQLLCSDDAGCLGECDRISQAIHESLGLLSRYIQNPAGYQKEIEAFFAEDQKDRDASVLGSNRQYVKLKQDIETLKEDLWRKARALLPVLSQWRSNFEALGGKLHDLSEVKAQSELKTQAGRTLTAVYGAVATAHGEIDQVYSSLKYTIEQSAALEPVKLNPVHVLQHYETLRQEVQELEAASLQTQPSTGGDSGISAPPSVTLQQKIVNAAENPDDFWKVLEGIQQYMADRSQGGQWVGLQAKLRDSINQMHAKSNASQDPIRKHIEMLKFVMLRATDSEVQYSVGGTREWVAKKMMQELRNKFSSSSGNSLP